MGLKNRTQIVMIKLINTEIYFAALFVPNLFCVKFSFQIYFAVDVGWAKIVAHQPLILRLCVIKFLLRSA